MDEINSYTTRDGGYKSYSDGDSDSEGCDQIANPFLAKKASSAENPYGGIFSDPAKSCQSDDCCDSTSDLKYYSKKADYPEDCRPVGKAWVPSHEPKYGKLKYAGFYQEDEMTSEAKKWMGKYAQLKSQQDDQMQWMTEYMEEVRREFRREFKEMADKVWLVVYEKMAELENKMNSNIN